MGSRLGITCVTRGAYKSYGEPTIPARGSILAKGYGVSGWIGSIYPLFVIDSDESKRKVSEEVSVEATLPRCQKCASGDLVPLSDFGSQGAPIHYKAWVCTNPDCGFNIKIRNGDVYLNEPISNGSSHVPRAR